jgi:hypothetical protein
MHYSAVGHLSVRMIPLSLSLSLSLNFREGWLVIASEDGPVAINPTQGWVIYGRRSTLSAIGHGRVPHGGRPCSSLRPEAGGFLGAMAAVEFAPSLVFSRATFPLRLPRLAPIEVTAWIRPLLVW